MDKYKNLTQEDFDRILIKLLSDCSAASILDVPGVYELISEDLNNDVIEYWEQEQENQKEV